MSYKAKEVGLKSPKHAIENGFAIGYFFTLFIDGESEPRQTGLENEHISDIIYTAISRQCPYGFIFAFISGAHQSVMGQFSFFDMGQWHIGGVINHYQSNGANDHIFCVLAGLFMPK